MLSFHSASNNHSWVPYRYIDWGIDPETRNRFRIAWPLDGGVVFDGQSYIR